MHETQVKSFINKLNNSGISEIIYLSDFNFASNDTYIIWKDHQRMEGRLIFNKKLKRLRSKKLKFTTEQRKDLSLLFNYDLGNSKLEFKDCESILDHYYFLKLYVLGDVQIIDSRCLADLMNNSEISSLFYLMK